MDWRDKVIEKELIIQTGDGKTYGKTDDSNIQILYKNPSKKHNFNAVAFEYNNLDGAQVVRGKESYREIPLEIYFQGPEHLTNVEKFLKSAKDTNLWKVIHPYYDDIICQPTVFEQNNSNDNTTLLTGVLWESLVPPNTGSKIDAKLDTQRRIDLSNEAVLSDASRLAPTSRDIAKFNSVNNKVGDKNKKRAVTNIDLSTINNAIYKTNAKLNNIGREPELLMRQIANIYRAPSRFYATITNRITVLEEAFVDMLLAVKGVPSLAERIYFEQTGALNIIATTEAAITKKADIATEQNVPNSEINKLEKELSTRSEILDIIKRITAMYEAYINQLSLLQSEQDNRLDSYYPSPNTLRAVTTAYNKCCANMFSIAQGALQERTYVLEEDLQIIPLVFMLYSKTDSETIETFVKNNDIQMSEYPLLEKGRKVKYYV